MRNGPDGNRTRGFSLTALVNVVLTITSTIFAGVALFLAVKLSTEERNARLVEIGVAILKVDPTKDAVGRQAREWALNLVEANSGGVKFSEEARQQLLGRALQIEILDVPSSYLRQHFNENTAA